MIERISDAGGLVSGMALDHRDSLRSAAARAAMATDAGSLSAFKSAAVGALAPAASVVLLDHELGADAIARLGTSTALLMPLEAQGYETVADGRVTTLLADFSPADARRLGAVGCKLLLPYLPERAAARAQEAVARDAIEACATQGLLLVLEPIVYEGSGPAFAEAVIGTARRLARLGPGVLKLQFPAGSADDSAACARLNDACGATPWVLLGGGAGADAFLEQLAIAVRAGARGFIAGRTMWEPALTADPIARERALREICLPLLRRAAVAAAGARAL